MTLISTGEATTDLSDPILISVLTFATAGVSQVLWTCEAMIQSGLCRIRLIPHSQHIHVSVSVRE